MTTNPSPKSHDHTTSDDASRRVETQPESNDQPVLDESDEKYDTSRMACTD